MKRIISLVMCLFMILTMFGCSKHFTEEGLKTVDAIVSTMEYHTSVAENYSTALKSGLYELLLDESTCSIALKDTVGTVWYSMPTTENAQGAMLTLEVTDGSKRFMINSQDNSVALGLAKCVTTDDGLSIQYTLQDKVQNPTYSLKCALNFKFSDGVLVTSIDMSKADMGKMTVLRVGILPTFGAVSEPKSGDFIVVPDGSGALIDLSTAGEASYTFDTYGTDSFLVDENKHPALFGAYGLKAGNSAFAAIVTDGDTISKINAYTGDIDRAWATFSYPTNELLSVSYKFISGSAATYATLASMCREQFTRDGWLSTRLASDEGDVPVQIAINGSGKLDYEDVEDLISILKAKGINDIDVKYSGAIKNFKMQSKVGNKKAYESLTSYLSSQGFGLFLTMDIMPSGINSVKEMDKKLVSFMKNTKKYEIEGYCLSDVGSSLRSTSKGTRQEFSDAIFQQAIALSNNKTLMVENGNLYTLKNAAIVSCLPTTTSYEQSDSYKAIPFAQMILHGTVEYTSLYLNRLEDIDVQILRCLEYGSLPAFILSNDEDSDDYYETWSAKALSAYELVNASMSDLRDKKITDHKKIRDGVYLTTYNSETYIYTNYTDVVVSYNGLSIKPMSYLRVN